tara:strand:- start:180 stop:629 length:450 start_codon:yes stop_codon:yes gene_type:complete
MPTTDNKKKLLLEAIKEYGGFIIARDKVGVPRSTYYQWLKEDETFKDAVHEAKESFGESMLQIAIDRLRNPDKGKGSDVLLIAVLNAYMSSTFRPTGANDSDTRVQDMVQEMREIAIKSEKAERSSLSEVVEDTLDNILAKKKSNDDTL